MRPGTQAALNLLDKLHAENNFLLREYMTIRDAIQNNPETSKRSLRT